MRVCCSKVDWVADPKGGYYSDYNLHVIVNHADLTGITDYREAAFNRLDNEFATKKTLEHPALVIVHDFDDVNGKLRVADRSASTSFVTALSSAKPPGTTSNQLTRCLPMRPCRRRRKPSKSGPEDQNAAASAATRFSFRATRWPCAFDRLRRGRRAPILVALLLSC